MLDTDQLRSFIAIVDTGSFTRAAERVHKTQSAVSMHIKRLEERLGKQLFIKHGRGVRLSRDGESLIGHARTILKAEAHALRAITGKGISGRIRLGIPDDYAEAFLAKIISSFSSQHPLVEVQVFCHGSNDLAYMMRKGNLDLSIITVSESASDIEILDEEPLHWVGCSQQIEHQRPLPIALGSPNCLWSQAVVEALRFAGIEMVHVLVSSNFAAIAPVIEAGLAITAFPESVIRKHHRIIPPGADLPPLPKNRIGIMVAATSQFSEIETMAELIRQTIRHHRRTPDT